MDPRYEDMEEAFRRAEKQRTYGEPTRQERLYPKGGKDDSNCKTKGDIRE